MERKVLLIVLVGLLLLLIVEEQGVGASVVSPGRQRVHEAGEFKRLRIPEAQVYASIQVISRLPDRSWQEPNHVSAWELDLYPGAFYLHRDGLGFRLDRLLAGSEAFLYKDWLMESRPLRLRVFKLEIIRAEDEALVWKRVAEDSVFAFVTCHPAGDDTAPQRLVVWATPKQGL